MKATPPDTQQNRLKPQVRFHPCTGCKIHSWMGPNPWHVDDLPALTVHGDCPALAPSLPGDHGPFTMPSSVFSNGGHSMQTKRHTNATLYFAFAAADSSYFMLVHGVLCYHYGIRTKSLPCFAIVAWGLYTRSLLRQYVQDLALN